MDWQGIVAIIGAAVAIAGWATAARKSKVLELVEIIGAMRKEIDRLKVRIVELEKENATLRDDNRKLVAQVTSKARALT